MRRTFTWPRSSSPAVQCGAQGSSRRTAQEAQRGLQGFVLDLSHTGQVTAGAPWLALRVQQAVARGQRRALRIVVRVVVGFSSLDRDVAQAQVTGAGADVENAGVFDVPLPDRRPGLVENLQGEDAERYRALGTHACEGFGELSLRCTAQQVVPVPRGRRGSAKRSSESWHRAHVSS